MDDYSVKYFNYNDAQNYQQQYNKSITAKNKGKNCGLASWPYEIQSCGVCMELYTIQNITYSTERHLY